MAKKTKKYTTIAKIKKLKSSKRSRKRPIKKTAKKSKKQSPWNVHLMNVYKDMKKKDKNVKFGDAMKAAKKTYKKK